MFEHYLSNKNERATVAPKSKFMQLNTASVVAPAAVHFFFPLWWAIEAGEAVRGPLELQRWRGGLRVGGERGGNRTAASSIGRPAVDLANIRLILSDHFYIDAQTWKSNGDQDLCMKTVVIPWE